MNKVDLSKLQSVKIGNSSLYYSLELNNLPSLQFIDIGEYCFNKAISLILTGRIDGWYGLTDLPQLQLIRFSNWNFNEVHSVVFESE